jgi:hypothetical protein
MDIMYACTDLQNWSLGVARKYEGIGFKGAMIRRIVGVKNI